MKKKKPKALWCTQLSHVSTTTNLDKILHDDLLKLNSAIEPVGKQIKFEPICLKDNERLV